MSKCTVKLTVNRACDDGVFTMSVEQAAELVCNNIYCQLTVDEVVTAIYENIDLTVHDLDDACKFARIQLKR